MQTDGIIKKIRDFEQSERCKSRHWLAKQAGVAEVSLRNMMDASWNPHFSTLRKLEQVVEDHSHQ